LNISTSLTQHLNSGFIRIFLFSYIWNNSPELNIFGLVKYIHRRHDIWSSDMSSNN